MTLLELIQTMNAYELAEFMWTLAECERQKMLGVLKRTGVEAEIVSLPAIDIANIAKQLLSEIGDVS